MSIMEEEVMDDRANKLAVYYMTTHCPFCVKFIHLLQCLKFRKNAM